MLSLQALEFFGVSYKLSTKTRIGGCTSLAVIGSNRFSFLYFLSVIHFTGIGLPTCAPRLSAFGSRSMGIGRLGKVVGLGLLALGSRAGTEVTLEPHLETRGIGQRVLADG